MQGGTQSTGGRDLRMEARAHHQMWRQLHGPASSERHVRIAGSGPRAAYVADVIAEHPQWGWVVVGFVDRALPKTGPAVPREQGEPSEAETEEMLLLANRKARELGRLHFGDEECFSIIYNGGRTRRKPWPHVHILPTRNLAAKRLAFLAFFLKNVLRLRIAGLRGPWRPSRAL